MFAPKKQIGKTDSAVIALEGLNVFTPRQRSFLNFWQDGQILAVVDKSTVSGIDPSLFTALQDDEQCNQMNYSSGGPDSGLGAGVYNSGPPSGGGLYGSVPPSAGLPPPGFHTFAGAPTTGTMFNTQAINPPYSMQQEMMAQQHVRPTPKMKPPTLGALAEPGAKTMQAFDSMTMQTLATRNRQSPENDKNSLDLASTLAHSLKLEPADPYTRSPGTQPLMMGGDRPAPLTASSSFVQSQSRQSASGTGLKQAVETAMEVDNGQWKSAISELHEIGQKLGKKPTFEIICAEGRPHAPM